MEKQLKQIHETVDKTYERLDKIWRKIGHDAASMEKRKSMVYKHANTLFSEMLEEEEDTLRQFEEKLEKLYHEILQLLKDLTMDNTIASETKDKTQGKTLLEAEKIYESVAEDLRKKKAVRMEKYNVVNDKLIGITEELDEELFTIAFEGIPSDAQVGQIEAKLVHLQKEKIRRQNLFKKLQRQIIALFQCLDDIPKNELERMVVADVIPEGVKILSMKTLHQLEQLEANKHKEVDANRTEAERLWQKIKELWSRLTVDECVRSAFEKVHRSAQAHIGDKTEVIYKPNVLHGLKNELQRLEAEKKQNMALFIGQVRDELTALWKTKCFMSDINDRFKHPNYFGLTEFTEVDFNSEIYTDELLEKHEKEVEYWRDFSERNKKLIAAVTKREHLFQQMRELDQKYDDPSRLGNRGGALLKLEKEKKMVDRSLPKAENELRELAQKFAEDLDEGHGMKQFLVFGQAVDSLIQADWEALEEEREKRREMRKKDAPSAAAGKTMMTTMAGKAQKRPGTPGSILTTPKRARLPGATPTPSSGRTMSSIITPSTGMGTVGSIASTTTTRKGGPGSRMNPPADNDNFARPATRSRKFATPLSSASGKKITSKIPASSSKVAAAVCQPKEQVNPSHSPALDELEAVVISPASSYSEFTDHLLCQSTLNSSTVSTITRSRKPLVLVPSSSGTPASSVPTKPERKNKRVYSTPMEVDEEL